MNFYMKNNVVNDVSVKCCLGILVWLVEVVIGVDIWVIILFLVNYIY